MRLENSLRLLGVTFVLRDRDESFYVEENAIASLWKVKKLPMNQCISGWCMLNGKVAVVEDIYSDPRIPHDAYKPTFVKSLAIVPVRSSEPISAIGAYRAVKRKLAEKTIRENLEKLIVERTKELVASQERLRQSERLAPMGALAAGIAHEINNPIGAIMPTAQNALDGSDSLKNLTDAIENNPISKFLKAISTFKIETFLSSRLYY